MDPKPMSAIPIVHSTIDFDAGQEKLFPLVFTRDYIGLDVSRDAHFDTRVEYNQVLLLKALVFVART